MEEWHEKGPLVCFEGKGQLVRVRHTLHSVVKVFGSRNARSWEDESPEGYMSFASSSGPRTRCKAWELVCNSLFCICDESLACDCAWRKTGREPWCCSGALKDKESSWPRKEKLLRIAKLSGTV